MHYYANLILHSLPDLLYLILNIYIYIYIYIFLDVAFMFTTFLRSAVTKIHF